MATTKAAQRAVNKYMKENYDRVNLTMPKGKKDEYKAFAESRGMSLTAYIVKLIEEDMKK